MAILGVAVLGAVALGALSGCQHDRPPEIVAAEKALPDKISYNWDVRPILAENCFRCHGNDAGKRKAGLRLDNKDGAYAPVPEDPKARAMVPGRPWDSELIRRVMTDDLGPALKKRCSTCHNDSKKSGKFSVASYQTLMKGGEDGVVVRPGDPARSELFRRISLAHDAKEFMPKDGNTPLTPDQTAAIGWWISVGAPKEAALSDLKVPDTVRPALLRALNLAPSGPGPAEGVRTAAAETLPTVPLPDPAAVADLRQRGFLVRPVTMTSGMIDIDITPLRRLQPSDLTTMMKVRRQIHGLNLARAGVTDADLKTIGQFDNLARLRLEENPITDAGLGALMGLKSLKSIDLYGAKITKAGAARLASLPDLQRIYTWRTGVSGQGETLHAGPHEVALVGEASRAQAGPMVPTSPAQMAAMKPASGAP